MFGSGNPGILLTGFVSGSDSAGGSEFATMHVPLDSSNTVPVPHFGVVDCGVVGCVGVVG